MRRRFSLSEIDDVPGRRWELISYDETGESWPEEYATIDEVFQRIRDFVCDDTATPPPQVIPAAEYDRIVRAIDRGERL